MNKLISTKYRVFVPLVGPSDTGNHNLFTSGSKMEFFKQNLTKIHFFINTLRHFMMLCKKRLKISSLFKVQTFYLQIR